MKIFQEWSRTTKNKEPDREALIKEVLPFVKFIQFSQEVFFFFRSFL